MFGSAEDHAKTRHMAARELRAHPTRYRSSVVSSEETYDTYAERMSLHDERGDHVALQALANASGWTWLVQRKNDVFMIEPLRQLGKYIGALDFDPAREHYCALRCHGADLLTAYNDCKHEADVDMLLGLLFSAN